VLLDAPGGHYWSHWVDFVREHLVDTGLASPEDMSLFEAADDIPRSVEIIERFYANYHSARYVGERLIIRLKRLPSPERLEWLNAEFADLCAAGRIEVVNITPAEAKDGDVPEHRRLALYPVHNFGRIRQLIDALNDDAPGGGRIPASNAQEMRA
jgi:hypothetical protein